MELMVKDLVVGYRDNVVIDGFNAAFSEGRTVVLGPNGSGKTTLLRAIAGVLRPLRGSITLDGKLLGKGDVGYVSHASGLDPNMSVRENLEFYAEVKGVEDFRDVANKLGIDDLLNIKVGKLSNGQRRLVEIAVATLGKPRIYLLDEPTDGLDVFFARRVRKTVKSLGGIVVYTSHVPSEVFEVADSILVLKSGRMVFYGDIAEVGGAVKVVARRERETLIIEANIDEVPRTIEDLRHRGYEVLEVRSTAIEDLLGEDHD